MRNGLIAFVLVLTAAPAMAGPAPGVPGPPPSDDQVKAAMQQQIDIASSLESYWEHAATVYGKQLSDLQAQFAKSNAHKSK